MAIKYVDIPERRKTIAILSDCKYSAVHKIAKVVGDTNSLCFNPNKYLMNDTYRAVVVCDETDEYDIEKGRLYAKKKLLDHYYEQLDKRLDQFADDLTVAAMSMHDRLGYDVE